MKTIKIAVLLLALVLVPITVSTAKPLQDRTSNASPAQTLPDILFIVSDDHGLGGLPSNWDKTDVRLPTLASLTGLEPTKKQLEGNDLTVLMKNPKADWNKTTVTTFGYKNYGVRSERYRYIVYADGTEELYDHAKDKWEWHNFAGNSDYAEVKEKMRKGIPAHHESPGPTYAPPGRKRKSR